MKKSYILLLASALTLSTAACSKKDDPTTTTTNADTTNLTASINAAQQVPVNNSTATGAFVGAYTASTKQLSYSVTYSGFTPTLAHIHIGAPGTNGSVAIPFSSLNSPITGTVTLTADQADKLLTSNMYVNMHSSAFPNGEIRGDIKKQ